MSIPSPFLTKVVGVSFCPGYPRNIEALEMLAAQKVAVGDDDLFSDKDFEMVPIKAELRRNPANEFDENAIEVHVPEMANQTMIGHIPKNIAARLAPLIDSGEEWDVKIEKVAVHPDHPFNPGVHLKVFRAEW